MSLVQAILTDNFVLVGADKRGIQGKYINENCNKLIQLNKQIIFGCTGGVLDNSKLFEGYCSFSEEYGLINIGEDFEGITYNEFVNIITVKYNKMKEVQENISNKIVYDICSLVCGYNGTQFEITSFVLNDNINEVNGITKIVKADSFPYKAASAGMIEHRDLLHKLVYLKRPNNILQYKNILYEVFERGSIIDDTINSDVCFAKIKKKDVL